MLMSILIITAVVPMSYAEEANAHNFLIPQEEMLELARQQLEEQDAMRFYDVIEERINEIYAQTYSSWRYVWMSGGGIATYTRTGQHNHKVDVVETYMSQSEYSRIANGYNLTNGFIDLVIGTTIGLASVAGGFLYSTIALINSDLRNQIVAAGGAYVLYTKDVSASASIALPWADSPIAKIPMDAQYVVF